jgi:AraC family transcriptional regulator, regulatory protein of adaptative response / methylated-DNA-[protein]-cysteine methyltransferase
MALAAVRDSGAFRCNTPRQSRWALAGQREPSGSAAGSDGHDRLSRTTNRSAWEAIRKRDRRYDGKFVYVALTTGIYCRPSCPARHPHRRNTLLFATAADAEREGFTACLRCHPKINGLSHAELGIKRTLEWIESHFQQPTSLVALSQVSGLSPNHLQQVFKRIVGLTPREFVDARRLDYLKRFILQGAAVSTASYQAGFGSSRALYERVSKRMGMTPGAYGRGGRGLLINYRTLRCRLGLVLIGSTDRGICALHVGESGRMLVHALGREFSAATLAKAPATPGKWVNAVKRCQEEDHLMSQMPTDLRRRVFEARAWKALR